LANIIKIFVACDVVDMDTCHIFSGRPWQHDSNVTRKLKRISMCSLEGLKSCHEASFTYPKTYKRKEA